MLATPIAACSMSSGWEGKAGLPAKGMHLSVGLAIAGAVDITLPCRRVNNLFRAEK